MSKAINLIYDLYQIIDPYTKYSKKFSGKENIIPIQEINNFIIVCSAPHNLSVEDKIFIRNTSNYLYNNNSVLPYWDIGEVLNNYTIKLDNDIVAESNGGEIIPNCILTVDGEKFTPQRVLSIYNMARKLLLSTLYRHRKDGYVNELLMPMLNKKSIRFNNGVYNFDSDVAFIVSLSDYDGNTIPVIGADKAEMFYQRRSVPLFALRVGNKIEFIDTFKYLYGDSDCYLTYYSYKDLTINDVLITEVDEIFNSCLDKVLITVATAVATEQVNIDENAIAKLLGLGGEQQ